MEIIEVYFELQNIYIKVYYRESALINKNIFLWKVLHAIMTELVYKSTHNWSPAKLMCNYIYIYKYIYMKIYQFY